MPHTLTRCVRPPFPSLPCSTLHGRVCGLPRRNCRISRIDPRSVCLMYVELVHELDADDLSTWINVP